MNRILIKKATAFFLILLMSVSAISCGSKKQDEKTKEASKERKIEKAKDKEINAAASPVYINIEVKNTWDGDGGKYRETEIVLVNDSDSDISDWAVEIKTAEGDKLDQNWNSDVKIEGGKLKLTPADYAKNISSKSKSQGVGLIYAGTEKEDWSEYVLEYKTDKGTFKTDNKEKEAYLKKGDKADMNKDEKTEESKKQEENANGITAGKTSGKTVPLAGSLSALHVEGTNLVNAEGKAVRLQGISTHGLSWFPQYVNEESFKSIRDGWNANIMRLAMYTEESGGYCNGDDSNREKLKGIIDDGVKSCVKLGMYVIIDWHILSDGNPMKNIEQAKAFFDEISRKYSGCDNVIYEICNEPNNSDWSSQIKPYADTIIPIIRANAPKSVIIVGTNTWSQDVDQVASDPLKYDNVMYALHFYAGTHKENLRAKAEKALAAGVPIFITECSITDASGNGACDIASANEWKDFILSHGLSVIEWSLSNKDESSAILVPGCSKTSGYAESDLTEAGKWYREMMNGSN